MVRCSVALIKPLCGPEAGSGPACLRGLIMWSAAMR